jgi:PadR family transcriptional regulator PadR
MPREGRRLVLLILAVLRQTPLHGYAIARRIEEESGRVFAPGEGLLYPLLHQLERGGLVQSSWEQADGRGRKVYSLTEAGRRRFEAELHLWKSETEAVMRVVRGVGEGASLAMG